MSSRSRWNSCGPGMARMGRRSLGAQTDGADWPTPLASSMRGGRRFGFCAVLGEETVWTLGFARLLTLETPLLTLDLCCVDGRANSATSWRCVILEVMMSRDVVISDRHAHLHLPISSVVLCSYRSNHPISSVSPICTHKKSGTELPRVSGAGMSRYSLCLFLLPCRSPGDLGKATDGT